MKTIIKFFLLLLLLSLIINSACYTAPYYPSSGIGYTDSPETLEKGLYEIFASTECNRCDNDDILWGSSVFFKRGIFKNFDLGINFPYINNKYTNGSAQHGVGDYTLGCKLHLLDETSSFPALGINFGVKPYSANPDNFGTGTTNYSTTLLLERKIDTLTLTFNVGYNFFQQYDGAPENHLYYVFNIAHPVSNKVSLELETYAEKSGLDGVTGVFNSLLKFDYSINDNLLIQIGPSFDLKNNDYKYNILAGISWTFR